MTLRALFAVAGALTFVPALAFLILFRPPDGSIIKAIARMRAVHSAWWVGVSLRLLATAVAAGGFRIMSTSIIHGDQPVAIDGWFDKVTVISTILLAASASLLFFFVYLAFRVWPAEEQTEEESND